MRMGSGGGEDCIFRGKGGETGKVGVRHGVVPSNHSELLI